MTYQRVNYYRQIAVPNFIATPSTILIPLLGASIDLWFATAQYYDSGAGGLGQAVTSYLSCSRASTGYAKTSAGTLTSFGTNTLRITNLGLLVEDARTNVILDSGDLGSGNWSSANTTATSNQSVAPDGTTTMAKLDDGVAGPGRHIRFQSVSITANSTNSYSVFVKDNGRRYVGLFIQAAVGTGSIFCLADLQTGTITDSGVAIAGTGTTFTSASIEAFTGGTYRISVTGIVNTTDTSTFLEVFMSDRATRVAPLDADVPSYTGSNQSIYAWGAQVEAGAFPSSYIPTTSTSATRAADAITIIGTLNTLLSTLPHSDVANIITLAAPPAGIWTVCGDDTDGPVDLAGRASTSVTTFNNTTLFDANFGTGAWTTGAKVAVGKAAGTTSLVANGGTVGIEAAAVAGTSGNIFLGSGASGFRVMFGYIRRFTGWNSKLADATLQGFTV